MIFLPLLQIPENDPGHFFDRILRHGGGAQVLGPVHEPAFSGHLGPPAHQFYSGKSIAEKVANTRFTTLHFFARAIFRRT